MKRRISIAKLHAIAPERKPGYVEAVLARSTLISETHLEISQRDFDFIRRRFTPLNGPGSYLKSMLETMGITASKTCKCNKMARKMDQWGPEETMKHIEEVVDVMQETAEKRGLPFVRTAGRALVRLACWRAKRSK